MGASESSTEQTQLQVCKQYQIQFPPGEEDGRYMSLFDVTLKLFESLPLSRYERMDLLKETFPDVPIMPQPLQSCVHWGGLHCFEHVGLEVFGPMVGCRMDHGVYEMWITGGIAPDIPLPAKMEPEYAWMQALFDGPLKLHRNVFGCTGLYWVLPVMYCMVVHEQSYAKQVVMRTISVPMMSVKRGIPEYRKLDDITPVGCNMVFHHADNKTSEEYQDVLQLIFRPMCDSLTGAPATLERTMGKRKRTDLRLLGHVFCITSAGVPMAGASAVWTGSNLYISSFCAATRMGMGTILMQSIQQYVRDQFGSDGSISLVSLANEFYEAMGFKKNGGQMTWTAR